ncbi:MAG: M56 family metallopeptidase [Fimbriimonadaceae bacterium]
MNAFASAFGQDLWRATWQGGAFIGAVFAICRCFRRLPASTRHWLWWLACLQLPLRLLFLSPLSLPVLPAAAGGPTLLAPAASTSVAFSEPGSEQPPAPSASRPIASQAALASQPRLPFSTVLLFGWGAGVATFLVLAARRLVRTRRLLRSSRPVGGDAESLVHALSSQLQVRAPALCESDLAPCPLLAGWLQPTIVLPSRFAAESNEPDLRMALAHELAHLKRRDLWFSAVPWLTQSLFFFHPLAWLAVREAAAACEEACDIDAMRLSGGSASAYARLLLSSAQSDVRIAALGAAFGFRLLQRRITMLSQSNKLANAAVRRTVATLMAVGIICSVPWTVTAQTPAAAAVPTKVAKKSIHRKARKVVKRHLSKKAALAAHRARLAKLVEARAARRNGAAASLPVNRPPRPNFGAVAVPAAPLRFGATGPVPGAAPNFGLTQPVASTTETRMGTVRVASGAALAPPSAVTEARMGPVGAPPALSGSIVRAPMSPSAGVATTTTGDSQPVLTGADDAPLAVAANGDRVTIKMHRTDIIAALRALFKAAGANYSIKSTVAPDAITCSLQHVTLQVALKTILESAKQNLTFRVEGDVYVVLPG